MSDIVLRRTNFQLPAVKNFDEEFEIKKTIGKGNFGAVYSAVHKESDYLLAVKRLHVEVQSELAELQREITIMQQCDCPFVVRSVDQRFFYIVCFCVIIGCCFKRNNYYFVFFFKKKNQKNNFYTFLSCRFLISLIN